MEAPIPPVGSPSQIADYDLSKEPKKSPKPTNKTGGGIDFKSPASIMRQMGFDPNTNMTPLQFLVAVINDDCELLFKREKRRNVMIAKGGIAMAHRLAAAMSAAKYFHMAMPTVSIQKNDADNFGEMLAQRMANGERRVTTKRVIMEMVEEISPDVPLQPASYPPEFENVIQGKVIREAFDSDEPQAEGDVHYNPDDDTPEIDPGA